MTRLRRGLDDPQRRAPLVEALMAYAEKDMAAFHTPGHKQGRGAPADLIEVCGEQALRIDLCELPEVDSLYNASGVLKEAQDLAASAYGADCSFFLVNGSTTGNIVMVMSVCDPGDSIIVPRNAHKSVLSALILSGARPVYMRPPYDGELGVSGAVTPAEVERALEQNPRAKAVFIVSPTYFGGAADIHRIADLCRARGVPLLVDEAHGPHLHFHPDLPASALSAGADMVVQSTHKIISGMTQASLLHIKGPRIDRARARKTLELIQSTSPSYVLMASLDAARRQMALSGEELLGRTIAIAEEGRRRLSALPGVRVFGRELRGRPGLFDLDVTKLTINVTGLGMTGFEARRRLNEEHNIQAEMATLHNVLLIVTLGNTVEDIERTARAFEALCQDAVCRGSFGDPPKAVRLSPPEDLPVVRLSPREAFFAEHARVPFERAAGSTSAELVAPYPPGVPILAPGEVISQEAIDYLRAVERMGGMINGPEDARLRTIKVVAS
jgi:arginine decarboxylase